jgi:phospholipase/carboxylesterase
MLSLLDNHEYRTRSVAAREQPVSHLVVLLHGFGADCTDLEPVARALGASSPHAEFLLLEGLEAAPGGQGRQWFSLAGITSENRPGRVAAAGETVSAWIDRELIRRGLRAEQLVVGGFSQGAILTGWLVTARFVAPPAAALMLSGRFTGTPVAAKLSTPVFIGHGARDPVIPVAEGEQAATALSARGAAVTKRVYPALAHGIGPDELRDVQAFLRDHGVR